MARETMLTVSRVFHWNTYLLLIAHLPLAFVSPLSHLTLTLPHVDFRNSSSAHRQQHRASSVCDLAGLPPQLSQILLTFRAGRSASIPRPYINHETIPGQERGLAWNVSMRGELYHHLLLPPQPIASTSSRNTSKFCIYAPLIAF